MIIRSITLVKALAIFPAIIVVTHAQTNAPTESPSGSPTDSPTESPTESPSESPTESPSVSPTESPTESPSKSPTESPSKSPTGSPTESPSQSPTESPSYFPTTSPTTDPTASPSESPTQSPTVLIGCPPRYVQSGTPGDYERGELVSHPFQPWGGDVLAVYECRSDDNYLHCPRAGFEPGTLYSDEAWIFRGSCNSAVDFIEPTASPSYFPTTSPTYPLWEKEGCPETYVNSGGYAEGDVVEKDGLVYECKVWPDSLFCVQAAFVPGGVYSSSAWDMLGSCTGTLPPEPPAGSSCTDPAYSAGSSYAAGDRVSSNGNSYECMTWPNSLYCSQAAFAPTGIYGSSAWSDKGPCGSASLEVAQDVNDGIIEVQTPSDASIIVASTVVEVPEPSDEGSMAPVESPILYHVEPHKTAEEIEGLE